MCRQSRGKCTIREGLIKILKLPALYAILLGITFSFVENLAIPTMFNEVLINIRGSYATLGMMIIGIGLADIKDFNFDFKFISYAVVVKAIIWPLVAYLITILDLNYFQFFDITTHKMLILFAVAPMAANNVVIASILNLHPDKVALSVVISTVIALFQVSFVPIKLHCQL